MILKWIQSVISRPVAADSPSHSAPVKMSKSKTDGMVDVAHEVLKADAEELEDLLQLGLPTIKRKKLKARIRKKVKSAIVEEFDDADIVEEVTERITNAAEFDPYYRRMFDE